MAKVKPPQRDDMIKAIKQRGRPCTATDIRHELKKDGLDLDPKAIAHVCRTLASKGILKRWPGGRGLNVMFGLPDMELDESINRRIDRRKFVL